MVVLCSRTSRGAFAALLDSLTSPAVLNQLLLNESLSYRFVFLILLRCEAHITFSIAAALLDYLIDRGLFKYVRQAGSGGVLLNIALKRFNSNSPPSASVTGMHIYTASERVTPT